MVSAPQFRLSSYTLCLFATQYLIFLRVPFDFKSWSIATRRLAIHMYIPDLVPCFFPALSRLCLVLPIIDPSKTSWQQRPSSPMVATGAA